MPELTPMADDAVRGPRGEGIFSTRPGMEPKANEVVGEVGPANPSQITPAEAAKAIALAVSDMQ